MTRDPVRSFPADRCDEAGDLQSNREYADMKVGIQMLEEFFVVPPGEASVRQIVHLRAKPEWLEKMRLFGRIV